jgi:hypothetical protein
MMDKLSVAVIKHSTVHGTVDTTIQIGASCLSLVPVTQTNERVTDRRKDDPSLSTCRGGGDFGERGTFTFVDLGEI